MPQTPLLVPLENINNLYLFFPQVQGAIMIAPLLQVVVAFTGIMGFLLKFIGPITVAPAVALVGIGLLSPAAARAGFHWGISVL